MSKTNAAKLVVMAVILGGALVLVLLSRRSRPPEVGDAAPDFTLPTLSGEPVSLRQFRENVVVLNFWATWCPPCIEETPSLRRFAEQMRSDGVAVLGVSVDQDTEALKKFVADYQLSFPIARDPDQAVASRYGTFKFPESYIIARDGRIADKLVGAVNWQDPRIVAFVRNLVRPGRRARL